MNKDVGTFLKLLRCSLALKEENYFYDGKVDWLQIFEYAHRNDLVTLLFPVIKEMLNQHHIPEEIYDLWKKYSINSSIYEQKKHYALRELIKRANTEQVTFTVLKGCVLADLYPQYQQRTSCDTDLYIDKLHKEKAVKILEKSGYLWSEKSKEEVGVYINDAYNHVIELHTCLWEDYTGPKMKVMEGLNITNERSFVQLKVCGIDVTSLGYTEHLIFQLFHMIKHFSLECGTIRHLIDISLYVNRYIDYIKLDQLWYALRKMGYEIFCFAIFQLCMKHFDMNSRIMISSIKLSEDKLEELLEEFVTNSKLFKDEKESWKLLGDMIPYFVGEKQEYEKEAKIPMKLFPSQERLSDKYYLGKKYKIMLPVSWVHRMFDLLITERKYQDGEYTQYERAIAINHKLKIMKEFGLINEENNNA